MIYLKRVLLFMLLSAVLLILLFEDKSWVLMPDNEKYPIRGIDVSHYQGDIDWNAIADNKIIFAFIKATEGSYGQDEYFKKNWIMSGQAGIIRGAYHFFSFDTPGDRQARNYLNTVPKTKNSMPPIIDIEFYGEKYRNKPSILSIRNELDKMIGILEDSYGKKPILYTTMKMYDYCIKGYYDAYSLWIRNLYYEPVDLGKRKWMFWQYSNKGKMEGLPGEQLYFDMNLFHGTLSELHELCNE